MSTRGSWQTFCELFCRYKHWSTYNSERHLPGRVTVAKPGHGNPMHQGQDLDLISTSNSGTWAKLDTNMGKDDRDKVRPPAPAPPRFNFALWGRWVLGSILTVLLPFWKQKWEKPQKIEGEAEMTIEEIENVAEVVEKVAIVAEKVSTQVADNLPDHTKLQDAALFVERISKAAAQDAQLTIKFIQKVDELKEDLNDLETMIEPIVNKIVKQESEGK